MEAVNAQVVYQEADAIRVGNFLISKGFVPARKNNGVAISPGSFFDVNVLSILHKDYKKTSGFSLFGSSRRRPLIADIYFRGVECSAKAGSWVIHSYGRDYVEMIKKLAEEMSVTFQTKISIRLDSETPGEEGFRSEFGGG